MVMAKPIPEGFVTTEWFQARVMVDSSTGCHVWTGSTNRDGYGRIFRGKATRQAHRVALSLAGFDIPLDAVVDHLCGNRSCVNPDHLDITTHRINIMRGEGHIGEHIRANEKGVCINGHVLEEVGMHRAGAKRTCGQCGRDRVKAYYWRKRVQP